MKIVDKQIQQYLEQNMDLYGNDLYYDNIDNRSSYPKIDSTYKSLSISCPNCIKQEVDNSITFNLDSEHIKIMFISKIENHKKDSSSRLIYGKSAELLNKMLKSINLNREMIFVLNFFNACSHIDDALLNKEILDYEPHIKKQIKMIKPNLIVALGEDIANILLRLKSNMSELRNEIYKYENIDFYVTYHPESLLKKSDFKRFSWEDLKFIRNNYLHA